MNKKEELLTLLTYISNEIKVAENLVRGLDFSADDVVKLYTRLNENLMQENLNLKTYLYELIMMDGLDNTLENLLGWDEPLPNDKVKFVKIIRDSFGFTLPQSVEIWKQIKEKAWQKV